MKELKKYFIEYREGKKIQKIMWQGFEVLKLSLKNTIFVEPLTNGIRIRTSKNYFELNDSELLNGKKISLNQDLNSILKIKKINFQKSFNLNFSHNLLYQGEQNKNYFTKSFILSSIFLCLILLIKINPTKTKDESLIPEQYAKVIFKPIKAKGSNTLNQAQNNLEQSHTLNNQKSMAKALKSKAVSKSIQGLLKGGLTLFLKESQNLSGSDSTSLAKRALDLKTSNGLDSNELKNLSPKFEEKLNQIGGKGLASNGTGYGSAKNTNVTGQGKAFIGIDTDNALVDEGLTKDEVGKVIHSHIHEIRYCHESAMLKNPGLEGKINLNFIIGSDGLIKTTEIKESTLNDTWLEDCVIRRLARWKFPNPRGGVNVTVSYPFIFKQI
jgi:hypothetical protein